ncbi:MAG: TolB family protein [Myxococcota bacterium]
MKGSPSEGVVFVRVTADGADLARARIATGEVVPLTQTPDRDESWPYWSELSRRLAFQTGPLNGRADSDLVLWMPRTGQELPVTRTPHRIESWASWSPAHQRLAFTFVGAQGSGVAVFDLEARGARLLARSGRAETWLRPTFAPDGSRIVVQRRPPTGQGSNLWLLEEGEAPMQLTTGPDWFDMKAWFTRNAQKIVYSRRPVGSEGWLEVAVVDVAGGEPRTLSRAPESDSHSARPSPTRDEIVFVSDRGGDFDVYLMHESGRDVRNITATPGRNEFRPRWSADGERILLTVADSQYGLPRLSDRESLERARVVVIDRDGEVLFETAGLMPDWMPPW